MDKPDFSTEEKCRSYIAAFRLDGESVGFLVSKQTGKEVSVAEASFHALKCACEGLWHLQVQRSKSASH